MENLLKETLEILRESGKNEKDVLWCGDDEFGWFSWGDFKEIANVNYSSGFGTEQIKPSLLVVGKDWWLERHEYDGSEWWEFKELPTKPNKYKKPKKILLSYENDYEPEII